MEHWVLGIFLACYALQYVVETALLLVNLRHVERAGAIPPSLAGRVDEESARGSRLYTLANGRFGLLQGTIGAAVTVAVLVSGLLPALDHVLARAGLEGAHRFVAYLLALALAGALASLPFAAWHTFVIEARFGFNRTSARTWALDRVKSLAIELGLGVPLLYATYAFMRFAGPRWWIWLFGFLAAFQVFMLWLYPAVIAPLFNRFTPLPEGPLRERLVALAEAAGFRHRGLFVMDASRRSGHSNAYFTGIFRPRIVLYDTLVDGMAVEEAASVLAHEIGHFRAGHVRRRLLLSLAALLVSLLVLSWLVPWPPLHAAFGFDAPTLHGAIAILSLGGGGFVFWLRPLASRLSRRHEYEADRFAVRIARAPEALKTALVRLNRENLSNLHPHPWYSAWHYSHPTLVERLAAIDREAAAEAAA
ncbi:MAG TPA: M48 family metallopeptidase [Anaeromyxobacter sp.]